MTEKPHGPKDMKCPLWKQPMSKVCHTCNWWTHLRGKHPQSEQEIDEWACAIAFLPMLMIENAQMQRGTQSAVESFRNEMVRTNQSSLVLLAQQIGTEASRAIGREGTDRAISDH